MCVCKSTFQKGRVSPGRLNVGMALLVLLASAAVAGASDSSGRVPDAIVRGIEANTL